MPIAVACPTCNRTSTVPDNMAGKKFRCISCSAAIDVPGPNIAVTVPPVAAGPTFCPKCNALFAADAVMCVQCGYKKLVGATGPKAGVDWFGRRGPILLARDNAVLPRACIKCGATTDKTKTKTFYWSPQWAYFFLGLIGHMIFRKQVKLTYSLCDQHRKSIIKKKLIAFGVSAIVLLLFIGLAAWQNEPAFLALGIFPFIIGLIVTLIIGTTLSISKIADGVGEFKGAKEPFLGLLDGATHSFPVAPK